MSSILASPHIHKIIKFLHSDIRSSWLTEIFCKMMCLISCTLSSPKSHILAFPYVFGGFLDSSIGVCLQCRRLRFNSWVWKIRWRSNKLPNPLFLGFPCGSAHKESACNAGDLGLIPGLGRSPGEGKGYPLQYSGMENSMDCVAHGVTKSRTQLSRFSLSFYLFGAVFQSYLKCCLLG